MMKIMTYFAFTLLSVLIQFGLMDYIQANLQFDDKIKDLNITSPKKRFSDILRDFSQNPHALYYQTKDTKLGQYKVQIKSSNSSTPVFSNQTTPEPAYGSENSLTTTVYDVLLYEENTTITETSFTSEVTDTTTDIENVTELTIFSKKNLTTIKPPTAAKKKINQDDCYCNLLYQVCDINCCCDGVCSDKERKMFNCTEKGTKINLLNDNIFCSVDAKYRPMLDGIENLFCVAKTNLPEKRNTNYKEGKYNTHEVNEITERTLKWHDTWRVKKPLDFSPKIYSIGDPLWVMRKGSMSFIDLPTSNINNYCDDRTPVYFLKDQTVQCNVVIRDLEMFRILRNVNETNVISFSEMPANSSALKCTSVHCTNWTIIVCDDATCTKYNENQHEPACTDFVCTNLAPNIEYVFYYHDSKITNATLYLHIQNVSLKVPFLKQVISVKFYLTRNDSIGIVKLSGNPGYLIGLPVIASYESGNYTTNFFSNESKVQSFLTYPVNKNGICTLSNITKKTVTFGTNKRSKCRYIHAEKISIASNSCQIIQDNLIAFLGIKRNIVISPLGNPQELKDEDWIDLKQDIMTHQLQTYSESKGDTLVCYNIISKLSFVFGYADISDIADKGKIKILDAKTAVTSQNLTFTDESISVLISVETSFVDITKPPIFEYAGSPQLNIHLPKDFFFPFPSNNVYRNNYCNVLMLLICIFITFISK